MKATDAHAALVRLRSFVAGAACFSDTAGADRRQALTDIAALQSALASPASLSSREELFDAVICDEAPEGEPSLLDDLLEQMSTGALVAYLNARLVAETERAHRLRTIDTTPDPEAP